MKRSETMKMFVKNSLSVLWKVVFANIICIFLILTVSTICTALTTVDIGYQAYGVKEGSTESELLYTYYNKDGEDTKKAEYESQGYTITTVNLSSDMPNAARNTFLVIAQLVGLSTTALFIYPTVWECGNKDSNRVNFGRIKEDKLRGFKIGLAAMLPFFLLFIALIIFALGAYEKFAVILYKFINCYAFGFLDFIIGDAVYVSDLAFWQYPLIFITLFIVPVIAYIAYILGYKDISVIEKIVYKKKDK